MKVVAFIVDSPGRAERALLRSRVCLDQVRRRQCRFESFRVFTTASRRIAGALNIGRVRAIAPQTVRRDFHVVHHGLFETGDLRQAIATKLAGGLAVRLDEEKAGFLVFRGDLEDRLAVVQTRLRRAVAYPAGKPVDGIRNWRRSRPSASKLASRWDGRRRRRLQQILGTATAPGCCASGAAAESQSESRNRLTFSVLESAICPADIAYKGWGRTPGASSSIASTTLIALPRPAQN